MARAATIVRGLLGSVKTGKHCQEEGEALSAYIILRLKSSAVNLVRPWA